LKHLTLNLGDNGHHEKRITTINKFVNESVIIELNEFRKNNKSYFGAGSLDSLEIEAIFKKFSINLNFKEYKLKEIKDERNFLAHGEKSFNEIGKDKSVSELLANSQKVIDYLEQFIGKVTAYINDKSYKNQLVTYQ